MLTILFFTSRKGPNACGAHIFRGSLLSNDNPVTVLIKRSVTTLTKQIESKLRKNLTL